RQHRRLRARKHQRRHARRHRLSRHHAGYHAAGVQTAEGLEMPALADPFAASPLLTRFKNISRADLEAYQLKRVRALCARLDAKSAFYREKFKAGGIKEGAITSLEQFSKAMPTSNKKDFLADQIAHPPFGSRTGVDRKDIV